MIYIDITNKQPPKDWCQKAEIATERIKHISDMAERNAFIKTNRLWAELKDWLLSLSHGKCWYTEAKEIASDYDVDHFRPKNKAKNLDGTEREGYWWLAFDWKNYRIAGTICNRPHNNESDEPRGKGYFFPLHTNCTPANGPYCDLDDEIIYILDPTNPVDPTLLTFDETGYPMPISEEKWIYERVKVTIKLLYLDYRPLVDERKKVWNKCNLLINEAQNIMLDGHTSAAKQTKLKGIFKQLMKMASPESELSSTASACLFSSGIKWAERLVKN